MNIYKRLNLYLAVIAVSVALVGCGGTLPINVDDNNAHSAFIQARIASTSGRIFQLEIEQYTAEDELIVAGANGAREERLQSGNATLVGPAVVDSSHDVMEVSVQANYTIVESRHFKFGWAPHLSYINLDSRYRGGAKTLTAGMKEGGIGAQLNLKYAINEYWSLNLLGKVTQYSSDVHSIAHNAYVRLQVTPQLNIDLGAYTKVLDVNTATGIIYESGRSEGWCDTNCTYRYEGDEKSKMEIDTNGIKLGLGWNF